MVGRDEAVPAGALAGADPREIGRPEWLTRPELRVAMRERPFVTDGLEAFARWEAPVRHPGGG
ncbi:hypothetical protein [Streptomyces sp. G-G2]|uniref:hypothetical protein n=1 Tax=Streptomyces sp. G-G2 TaxID=3046201 RepID=UPI0024B90256|nr:hypothetical protein [Streptomyces sp. G-G2]MDJ0385081.1 hypothetical protein [Streptomyces sp. G-G2]